MFKLYAIAYQRILKSLQTNQITHQTVNKILHSNQIPHYPDYIFHRLAKEDFKYFIKNPCPINKSLSQLNDQQTNTPISQEQAIIRSSKKLREVLKINEKRICNKCPFKEKCALQGTNYPQNNDYSEVSSNSVSNLLLYMQHMFDRSLSADIVNPQIHNIDGRVWKAGYKLNDTVLSLLQDLKKGGQQTREFQQIRLEYIEDKKQQAYEKEQEKKKSKSENNSKQRSERRSKKNDEHLGDQAKEDTFKKGKPQYDVDARDTRKQARRNRSAYEKEEAPAYKGEERQKYKKDEIPGYKKEERPTYKREQKSGYKREQKSGYKREKKSGYKREQKSGYKREQKSGYKREQKSGYKREEKSRYEKEGKEKRQDNRKKKGMKEQKEHRGINKRSGITQNDFERKFKEVGNKYKQNIYQKWDEFQDDFQVPQQKQPLFKKQSQSRNPQPKQKRSSKSKTLSEDFTYVQNLLHKQPVKSNQPQQQQQSQTVRRGRRVRK